MFQKSVHASMNLPLNYAVAPCLSGVQRIIILYPWRDGSSTVLWLPLTGYARQHPERQEWRAVPALNNKMIYVDFVEEGMAEGFNWDAY